MKDPFDALGTFDTGSGQAGIYRLRRLEDAGLVDVSALPFSIRLLLESVLRHCDGHQVTEDDVKNVAGWNPAPSASVEIPFKPARVVMQDFTGVPAIVDLAAMRSAIKRLGGDPARINPLIPVDLVVDHSVQVDHFGSPEALERNVEIELRRNRERYELLRWGQQAFDNFRVVPPAVGIVHQVNLELLAQGVFLREQPDGGRVAVPDTVLGTDSHTTMIAALGVLGWGVGGIEAEAVLLGQPLSMVLPEVVGLEMVGRLPPGATPTDLVLTVTEMLRREGVVGKFVEYFGPGTSQMTVPDRALVANMAPEYGATAGFFPTDEQTLAYLRQTGRSDEQVGLVERYCNEQELFRRDGGPVPRYSKVLSLDLDSVEPSLAGPKRPQDRVPLGGAGRSFRRALAAPAAEGGFAVAAEQRERTVPLVVDRQRINIGHGAVVIASITSCTNTSNPSVMLAAGLLAQKAVQRGLRVAPQVKTSLAPGSRVVTDYLRRARLDRALEPLGFHTVGYGCMTCIGNSGPLPDPVAQAVGQGDLVAAAVLSGNRNFEGRIHPQVKANYLASPPLVVAFALAGTIDIDLRTEPLGTAADGRPVYLNDLWPSPEEIDAAARAAIRPEMFRARYRNVFQSNPKWNEIPVSPSELFPWNPESTYIQEPPFLLDPGAVTPVGDERGPPNGRGPIEPIRAARVLLALGDSITTDHISPAGAIAAGSPAGRYLRQRGVQPIEFNTYGSRRGNHEVMTRGTFANIRIRNLLAPGTEGGRTRHLPDGQPMTVYEAAMRYQAEGVPLVVLAGREYGSGSSRDWAAKGTRLLGVRAVIASSFERIHRSNLVGMGVLPLELPEGQSWQSLGLSGEETFDVADLDDGIQAGCQLRIRATAADGTIRQLPAKLRIDTPVELEYYRHGGILPAMLRKLMPQAGTAR